MDYPHEYNQQPAYTHDFTVDSADPTQACFQHNFEQPLGASLQDQSKLPYPLGSGPQSAQKMSCEVKPRLTKEQHDILEAHYQKQQKPNTSTKKSFAESLNVSLEKVNNWFQNRRAKSKQDAKKQLGTVNYNVQSVNQLGMASSDTETSPAFPSPDYLQMLQQYSAEDSMSNELDMQPFQHSSDSNPSVSVPLPMSAVRQDFNEINYMPSGADDIFNNAQAINRRTLTQEQFDAFVQHDMISNPADSIFLNSDPVALNRMLAELNAPVYKQNDDFAFPMSASAAMPSDDSTVPSTSGSEQSMLSFPASSRMQDHSLSASTSDWTDSRSSSVSLQQHDDLSTTMPSSAATTRSWQPGQSVPVDFDQLNQEFQKVAQARQYAHPQQVSHEQPLAWPTDDPFERTDSQTSMLTQSMGNFAIQTPQPQQQATFKSPTPVSSLAARRQRQRPAPLGLASLRSQSYSGTAQPSSPSSAQQSNLTAGQQLRRIKSSNIINGVAPGRVQKSVAPPQRSPLSWNFTDAMNSPQASRHQSSNSSSAVLAPPTPMSPREYSRLDQARQMQQQWQSTSGHISRQASISETDFEHGLSVNPHASLPPQNFTSPPHTPMYHGQQQQGRKQSNENTVITENTPPQSAPASQQSFPSNVFAPPPQQPIHQHHPSLPQISQPQQQMLQAYPIQQQQQQHYHHHHHLQPITHAVPVEQQYQMVNSPALAPPQFTITTSGPPMDMAMQYAQHGMPIVDAQGQIQVAMPSQLQFVQQTLPLGQHQPHGQPPAMTKGQNTFIMTGPEVQPMHVTAQVPKQSTQTPSEFFVHEYTPPQEIKRTVTPRKPLDTGPKNYTFANQGPEHFEKSKKGDMKSSTTSNSPSSAASS